MKIFYICLLLVLFAACTKSHKAEEVGCTVNEPAWLTKIKAENISCACSVGVYQGVYKAQAVIEVRVNDPLCNGVNIVYRKDGSIWFSSADKDPYQDYLANAKQLNLYWKCPKQ